MSPRVEGRTTRLSVASAATPAILPDLQHTHDHPDDTMGLDFADQLLTPENSRSETSSNNENASNEEKPAGRRRSARVTRASLGGPGHPDNSDLESHNDPKLSIHGGNRKISGETLVNTLSEGKKSRSSLRHSLAVMETSLWSGTTLTQNVAGVEDHPEAPNTPISNASQEPQPAETGSSEPQMTLRRRVQQEPAKENKQEPAKIKATPGSEKFTPTRRSSRLSILGKASGLVGRASTVLGKRSRGMVDKGKGIGRRASLRPRVPPKEEEPAKSAANEPPAAKKRRLSESDLPSKTKSQEEEAAGQEKEAPKPVPHKRKRWLAHGLYSGQEPSDTAPHQNNNRNKRKSEGHQLGPQRKYLPLPMFAGARLMNHGRDFQLPFDVYSPLPPGQPKPDEWRKTNKNVFVGDAGSIWRAKKPVELSKCLCIEETGCDENCQNRYMFYECDNGNCGLGPECGNRNFDELKHRTKAGGKYNIGVEVIKTDDRGYGVRSNRTFEPNQIIVEYTGEIITQAECEKRMRSLYKNNECYYLMYFDQNMIIDATRGSIARFVNHSCQPNCRMEKWTVAGKPRMALFAGDRGVMTGEELTYDYNFDPYSQKNVQQCRCGSEKCRGVLGPRLRDKEQRALARLEEQKKLGLTAKKTKAKTTAKKRKLGEVIDESAARLNKKRKLLTPKSIKAGVKKAVSRARNSVSKSAAPRKKQPAAKPRGKASKPVAKKPVQAKAPTKSPRKSPAKSPAKNTAKNTVKAKDNLKLPKVKSKAKVKATVRPKKTGTAGKAQSKKSPSEQTSSPTKLSRPSAETKAKILATAKGTAARKRQTKEKKGQVKEKKSPVKGASKPPATASKARTASKGVKTAAKSVVRTVTGKKN